MSEYTSGRKFMISTVDSVEQSESHEKIPPSDRNSDRSAQNRTLTWDVYDDCTETRLHMNSDCGLVISGVDSGGGGGWKFFHRNR